MADKKFDGTEEKKRKIEPIFKDFNEEPKSQQKSKQDDKVASTGLSENVAGLLCYLFWFVGGIVFLLIEKENRFIRFHAVQSIALSIVFFVLNIVLTVIPIIGWLLSLILTPVMLILWIFLMYQAYQGKYYKLPILGELSDKQLK
ncbi:DUF4870 domain-containing protein [Bacillus sp. FJAT-49732]|uniref:DUF4870 domain-containing protein n=1 Tax=Lederbergia citrisecunda TaxID=2833583 RepID=A0A942TLR9_9BACI|nr:DUF4870 domain-containing protein [Lederbergia citrisecunda]MBS4200505.1 DUF4870 domain-containing protein [Lederbergia citrisecunda]